ncbi:hypothetical protein BV22DRAFT_757395 [Leucogyrophana mollusca]|uniref:Uncharacterized protein n=1 Tax=Leucogyrophana mollusca TaxID=85980 RepID=A0ACB8B5Y4_9AGAM|nr:hypothetical protein BV22DRAFT_757395 [Leucogyrophana mollusca]
MWGTGKTFQFERFPSSASCNTRFYPRLNNGTPYVGFLDCGRRIIDEEGWRTPVRGCGLWWTTQLVHVPQPVHVLTGRRSDVGVTACVFEND